MKDIKLLVAKDRHIFVIFIIVISFNLIAIFTFQNYARNFLVSNVGHAFKTLISYESKDKSMLTDTTTKIIVKSLSVISSSTSNLITSQHTITKTGLVYKKELIKTETLFKEFKENHKRIVETLDPKRFVYVARVDAGYGNKMYSLLTGFTVAIVKKTALIVNWTDIDSFIEEPMHKCFQTDNNTYNELNYIYRKNETYYFPYLVHNSFNPNKKISSYWGWRHISMHNRLVLTGIAPIFFDLGVDKSYYQAYLDYNLVSAKTIQAAWNIHNKESDLNNTAENLNILYQVGFELANSILKIFWNPSRSLKAEVDNFVEKYFKNYFVIGIQLRYWYVEWDDTLTFFECAIEIEKKTKKPVKWFVTTDSENELKRIASMHPNKVIFSNGTIGHVVHNRNALFRTLLDIELMARVDELIVTGGSTYGFMGALRSGKFPFFVNGRVKAKRCERFTFSNGCGLTPGQPAASF